MSDPRNLVILHIGDEKTGSTSIQRFFKQFQLRDAETGLWYPSFRPDDSYHNVLPHAFNRPGRDPRAEFETAFSRLDDAPDGTTAVISTEPLHRVDPGVLYATIPDRFKTGTRWDMRVVSYIRPHISHVLSNFQQVTKVGKSILGLEQIVPLAAFDDARRYAPRLEAHRRHWGDRYIARPFIRNHLKGGDVVLDFIQVVEACGARVPAQSAPPPMVNTSLSAADLAATRYMSSQLPISDMDPKQLRRELRRFRSQTIDPMAKPACRLELGPKATATLQKAFTDDAPRVDQFMGIGTSFADALAATPARETTPMDLEHHFTTAEIETIHRDAAKVARKVAKQRGEAP